MPNNSTLHNVPTNTCWMAVVSETALIAMLSHKITLAIAGAICFVASVSPCCITLACYMFEILL